MEVSFVDLAALHEPIREELDGAIASVVDKSAFILGDHVEKFEEEWAKYCGTKYALGVSSGTAALHLALLAAGIGKGDEVITVANTYFATAEAISYTGATPVFVDIDPATCNIDPFLARDAVTDRTRAIIPVHLYGRVADMDNIMQIAQEYSLVIIEDACQAHGATYREVRAGSIGHIGCFSFYPSKNLGAFGDAGAVVTDDPNYYSVMKKFRSHGQETKGWHPRIGYNYRMDAIQAAVLSVKLPHLDDWNERRRAIAAYYDRRLMDVRLPKGDKGHVYHLYAIHNRNRNHIRDYLTAHHVSTGLHYPTPIHLQMPYYFDGETLPHTEASAKEELSLPMHPAMTFEEAEYVAKTIEESGYVYG